MINTLLLLFALAASSCSTVTFDLVILGGRVMDPETGLDAVRNVGIQGSQIAVIAEDEISGTETLNDVHNITINGTLTAVGNATITETDGHWTNSGTFNAGTSTFTIDDLAN